MREEEKKNKKGVRRGARRRPTLGAKTNFSSQGNKLGAANAGETTYKEQLRGRDRKEGSKMAGKSESPRENQKTVRNSETHTSRKRQGNTKGTPGATEEAVKVQRAQGLGDKKNSRATIREQTKQEEGAKAPFLLCI